MKIDLIDAVLKKLIDEKATPSANLAVITKTTVLYKSVGFKQLVPTSLENDLSTIYDLASLTKVVATTSAILKLIEAGQLALDTKVKTILKDFAYEDIEIFNLINHTSGIEADVVGYRTISENDFYKAVLNPKRIAEIGDKVIYSDINFILLGLIIKQCTGSLSDFVQTTILNPLEMNETAYGLKYSCFMDRVASYEMTQDRGLVKGIVHDGKCFKMGGISGHAGLFSTMQDLSNFTQMILNDGLYKGTQVLSEASVALLFKSTTENLNESRSVGWILGDKNYPLGRYASAKTLFHTGFSGGSILIDKAQGVAIILLANRVHPSRDNIKLLSLRKEVHEAVFEALGLIK